jgi:hypothetical protein
MQYFTRSDFVKNSISQIVGKTIESVVIASRFRSNPSIQVFLIFSDGTQFEFYGADFSCAGDLDEGGVKEAIEYAEKFDTDIMKVFP